MAPSVRAVTATVARILICALAFPAAALNQTQTPSRDQSDVVRVFTELVQTDVMVFDKNGDFKDNLKREDFELRIDGKVKPIEFFDRIAAGSPNEEAQIAAARGSASVNKTKERPVPLDRGRTVFFYVDDFHLNLSGANAARKVITRFIDAEMSENDEAVITSASGQLGFLQQLTNNKTVLRRALERLNPQPYMVQDMQHPAMTEFQALRIDNFDRDVTDFFVDALLLETPGLDRRVAEHMVQARANLVVRQAAHITRNSFVGLESVVRSASSLPGQKLLFLISNGFFINDRQSDVRDRLQRISSAAARNGVVIYSMDARGLVGALVDASTDAPFDSSFRLRSSESSEMSESQNGLYALAHDTGGRAIFNSNELVHGLKRALAETSVYYLLAWKPDAAKPSASKFRRIEVKLINKPGLTARMRRGFYDLEPREDAVAVTKKEPPKQTETKLWSALGAPIPNGGLPMSLSLSYIDTPQRGPLLSSAMQVPSEFLTFNIVDGKSKCVIEVVGGIYNDKGQQGAKLDQRLTIVAPPADAELAPPKHFKYTFPVHLAPGLYQGRFGIRDVATGRIGTAYSWIEIPPMKPGEVQLSSLHIGERIPTQSTNASISADNPMADVDLSIDRRFNSSNLRFLIFVYNAARGADSKPDVAIQVLLIRDGQPVVTTALKKIATDGASDLSRIPYAAELALAGLPTGRYLLKVNVIDRVSKRSATQESSIEIE